VDDRRKFIEARRATSLSMRELCARFGISRKTGYKLLARHREEGDDGLSDRSRERRTQAHKTSHGVEQRVVAAAREFPCWGPRKLIAVLQRRHPRVDWPAKSTAFEILRRHGLRSSQPKHFQREFSARLPLTVPRAPNDLWCTDFKGWCLSGDRQRCEPLTIGDGFSRFAIGCVLVRSTKFEHTWPHFENAFREYGLPHAIRSDSGPPFSTHGLAGLSRMAVRWLRLGIRPERVMCPQQNGMIERFNLTVAIEAMRRPQATRSAQQREIERFRMRFNEVRPHEALRDRTPAQLYHPSARAFPKRIPEFEYDSTIVARRVHDGEISWRGLVLHLGDMLTGECVGFEQLDNESWSVRLGPLEVAIFSDRTRTLLRHRRLIWVAERRSSSPPSAKDSTNCSTPSSRSSLPVGFAPRNRRPTTSEP